MRRHLAAAEKQEDTMPKLTDTQLVILTSAAKRDDGSILPLSRKLPGCPPDPPKGPDSGGHGTAMATVNPVPAQSPTDVTLAELASTPLESLRELWARRYGRPPPRSLSRRLLEYAAAYDIQARIYGGLKPAVRRKLLQVGAKSRDGRNGGNQRKPQSVPSAGSRLVREWHGRSHTVEVTDRGFLYAGQHYRSLSEVARAITGARWSGPRFFGL
jgi:hypothetical protein